ncbi:hypothetical protein DIU31_022890 [Mucilaginibacter rubeus]|uniref:Uncharacterized protein n=2 Tax=Mucilaginibacter rubeus TaxID=2027860 RepID=A0A364WTM0_9SPHI|nr:MULTISPECIES: hypothetical protein [Mucilaginibacter]QEM06225.1 hypothetical protein DIU31_022890 [Mucilaginibacter rubeus]QEM13742.1 hypothetical protein DEO27_028245 [Mucilaginibacter rubeus]QEM18808.1 hypothetical protein DIU38_023130 [Mucilaginibacter gossypii]QTE36197.1 hypothetical protein J3L18_24165 [Mucilaginibacter gossypii]QTE44650.1 hypothetical protein J3L19_04590 [Mucilaginibacter rubeus]
MWKRIHSNRDPRDTLYSEIHKEFDSYFAIAGNAARRLANAYPRFIMGAMIFLMALSFVLSFTVFRKSEKANITVVKKVNPVEDGFRQILQATGNIRETMKLKKLVDSLTAKKQLSAVDSTLLDSALDRLSKIHQTLK